MIVLLSGVFHTVSESLGNRERNFISKYWHSKNSLCKTIANAV